MIYKDVEILAIEYEDEFLGIIWNALAEDEFAADLIHAEEELGEMEIILILSIHCYSMDSH
jgi:hypothetical protein